MEENTVWKNLMPRSLPVGELREQHSEHHPGGHGEEHVLDRDPEAGAELLAAQHVGPLLEPHELLALVGEHAPGVEQAQLDEPAERVEEEHPEDHERRHQVGVAEQRLVGPRSEPPTARSRGIGTGRPLLGLGRDTHDGAETRPAANPGDGSARSGIRVAPEPT